MDRVKEVVRAITVEPVLFIYMVGTWLNFPTFQGLYFHKVCLTHYPAQLCGTIDNGSYPAEETSIHAMTSQWMFYDTLCLALPSLIMAPYFGSWSDKISRKIPLILPPIGAVLGCINYIFCSLYPGLPIGLVLVSPLLNGLCGGFITTILGVFSYVGSVSTRENRNIRISVLESMSFLGGTVGLGLSGVLLDRLGFTSLFGVIMTLHLLIIIYVIAVLPSQPITDSRDDDVTMCAHLFGLGHFKNYIKSAFKRRDDNARRHLLMVCFSLFLVFLCFAGTRDITFLYLKKSPLSWSRDMYGYYQAYQNTVYFLALFLLLPLLKKLLGVSDPVLVILGLVSTMSSLVLLGFTSATWMVFMVPLLGLFHGYAAASSRALASQLVSNGEQGRIFAFIGSSETVASLLASGLFNYLIYPHSLSFFPGLSFLVMACVLSVSLCLVGGVFRALRLAGYPYSGFGSGEDRLSVHSADQAAD